MLSKPFLHNLIGKWALALTEYSLTYNALKAIKGQIIANFIVNHSLVDETEAYVCQKIGSYILMGLDIRKALG